MTKSQKEKEKRVDVKGWEWSASDLAGRCSVSTFGWGHGRKRRPVCPLRTTGEKVKGSGTDEKSLFFEGEDRQEEQSAYDQTELLGRVPRRPSQVKGKRLKKQSYVVFEGNTKAGKFRHGKTCRSVKEERLGSKEVSRKNHP